MQNKLRTQLLNKFKKLKFDEPTHTYTLGKKVLPSVSSLLKKFYDEFDKESVGPKYALKRGFDVKDVFAAWQGENQISVDKGHKVHLFAEDYCNWKYFNIGERPRPFCKQSLAVVEFWANLPPYIVPLVFELRMYNEELGYSGTADVVATDSRDNTLVILDYKTNKELFSEKFPQPPMKIIDGLRQDNFGKYSLQLSFYQILLEKVGFKVKGRVIIWLQESEKLYQTFQTKDFTQELLKLQL